MRQDEIYSIFYDEPGHYYEQDFNSYFPPPPQAPPLPPPPGFYDDPFFRYPEVPARKPRTGILIAVVSVIIAVTLVLTFLFAPALADMYDPGVLGPDDPIGPYDPENPGEPIGPGPEGPGPPVEPIGPEEPVDPNPPIDPVSIARSEWAYEMTQITEMNDLGYYGDGIVIGIVDSGIDPGHPDIDAGSIIAWKDFVRNVADPYDDEGHGTSMAGIIMADGAFKGIAPEVKLIVAKAIQADGSGTARDVADGIEFTLDPNNDGDYSDGADIISLSLGFQKFGSYAREVAQAAEKAASNGVFVVASAGNDGDIDDGNVDVPASEELVIGVGAIDENGEIGYFSSIGDNTGYPYRTDPDKKPEVVAPGVGITTTYLFDDYVEVYGTSPSAAFVSGSLALLLESHPEYKDTGNSDAIIRFKNHLMNTSLKLPGQDTPHDDHYGYGLIQVIELNDAM